MSAQNPGAYGLSALVHGGAVALVLFFSYAADRLVKDEPKVFELVAGPGDNYAATAAPALGGEGGIKVTPQAPIPTPLPEPPAPKAEPSPIQAAPETVPVPAPAPRAKAPPKSVDLLKSLKQAEARRTKRLEARYEKEKAAEEKRLEAQRKIAHVDAEGIREGVIGGSAENKKGGAGGKALTREEGNELEAYFALLLSRIKESHTPPEGVADNLSAKVELFVAADGSISHVRITSSSGNAEFDRSVIDACEHTRSIGPRPDGRSETVSFTFKMREDEST
ncbi:MAG TPA: energy transducer TonB [Opitutaceae bacterium]